MEGLKEMSQKIAAVGKMHVEDQRKTNDEFIEVNKKLKALERSQEERYIKYQLQIEEKLKESENENRLQLRSMKDEINKLREEFNSKIEYSKTEITTIINQKNTQEFLEFEKILDNFKQEIKNTSDQVQQQDIEMRKNLKDHDERFEKLEKKNIIITKQLKALKANQEELQKKIQADFMAELNKYDKKKALETQERDEVISKQFDSVNENIEELKNRLNSMMGDKEADQEAIRELAGKWNKFGLESKITELQNNIEEINSKIESLTTSQQSINELKGNLKAHAKDNDDKFRTLHQQLETIVSQYEQMEVNSENSRARLERVEKLSKLNNENIITTSNNLQEVGNSHQRLIKRVDALEKRLDSLVIEIRGKLGDCAKEFQAHRDVLTELMDERTEVYVPEKVNYVPEKPNYVPQKANYIPKKAKVEEPQVANFNDDVVVERLIPKKRNAQINTEEVKQKEHFPPRFLRDEGISVGSSERNIEIQTDKVESPKKIIRQEVASGENYNKPIQKESSEVFVESPKAQSEYLSEGENEGQNLDQLIAKNPNRVTLEEVKKQAPELSYTNEGIEWSAKKKEFGIGNASQQTDEVEEVAERSRPTLRGPSIAQEFLLASPRYLREDEFRHKDKNKIISVVGSELQANISTQNFRKPERFTVNLDDMSNIEQPNIRKPTYAEVADYKKIDFNTYEPQIDDDMGSYNQSEERVSERRGNTFRSTHIIKDPHLESIPENQLYESPMDKMDSSKQNLSRPKIIEPEHEDLSEGKDLDNKNSIEDIKESIINIDYKKPNIKSNSEEDDSSGMDVRASLPFIESKREEIHKSNFRIMHSGK